MMIGDGAEEYTTDSSGSLGCQPVVQDVVFGPMRSDVNCKGMEFTIYRSRTYRGRHLVSR
jgi:hypothetical protein